MAGPPPPVHLTPDYQGRGRALLSSRTIKPGETILSDSPILLYPTITPTLYCSHCLRSLHPHIATTTRCPTCPTPTHFCSHLCHSKSQTTTHTPWVCHALSKLLSSPPQDQILFLIHAYNLAATSSSDFHRLLSLQGTGDPEDPQTQNLHSLLCSLSPPTTQFGVSVQLTSALLEKDRMNAFGLMEKFEEGKERWVRGYGIYASAAFFNHDCLPNACRFDYVDMGGERNTEIVVRAIHEIPEGREVCLSYFPVNWGYKERQRRLLEDYGFQCKCDRCEVEKNWNDDDEEEEEDGGGESMEEEEGENGGDERMGSVDEEENVDFPHAYFFVKFLCGRESCGGTLAPLPPLEGQVSDKLECNVCGCLKKEEEVCGEEGDGIMLDN